MPDEATRPIRVVISKVGLDGHDVGARVIATGLRDAGMEVIYLGLRQTPENIVRAAIEEDADVVGISILSGAHLTFLPRIVEGLRQEGAEDVLVICGGVIPDHHIPLLKEKGVAAVFTAATRIEDVVRFIRSHVRRRAPA